MKILALLLFAVSAWAGPVSVDTVTPFMGNGNPDNQTRGFNACNRYCDQTTGQWYRFNGPKGATTPWVLDSNQGGGGTPGVTTTTTIPQVVCGDGVLSPTEQCDFPNIQGGCTAPSVCQNDCTCSITTPINLCGNGVLDSGEACDATADGSPCQTNCTAACKCNCTCQNGSIETGCASGTDENCEYITQTVTGANLGTAVSFTAGRINTTLDTAALDQATLNDQAIWEFFLDPTALPAAGQTAALWWKISGLAAGDNGWRVYLLSNGQIGLEANAGAGATQCFSAAGAVAAGQRTHWAITRNGSQVKFFRLNQDAGEQQHTQSGSTCNTMLTTFGNASTQLNFGARTTDTLQYNGLMDHARYRFCGSGGTCVTDFVGTPPNGPLDVDWDDTVTTGPAVSYTWDFNDATSATIRESITGTNGTGSGTLSLVDSPFDSGSTGTTTTQTGCSASQACNPNTCVCQDPGTSGARSLYISPTGNDANPCTTGAPCLNYQWVACGNSGCNNPNRARPGDTIIFKDGTYANVRIICGSVNPSLANNTCNGVGANTQCGTSSAPITIKAENERKALLRSSNTLTSALGATNSLHIEGCQYVIVQGFDTVTADNTAQTGGVATIAEYRNSHVTLSRILGFGNNRCGNGQVFESIGSSNVIYEENEAWNDSRHAFSCSGSTSMTYRRNYINNNGVGASTDPACLANGSPRGGVSREAIALYPCSNSFVENNLIEGTNSWGINVEGATWSFQGERAGTANTIIGNIVYNAQLGMKLFTRDCCSAGSGACPTCPTGSPNAAGIANNVVRNNIVNRVRAGGSFGVRDSVTVNTTYDFLTVTNGQNANQAFVSDNGGCTSPPCVAQLACSQLTPADTATVNITNSAFCGNGGVGVDVTACGNPNPRCSINTVRSNNTGANFANLASTCAGGAGQCTCATKTTTACTGLGDTGTDCLTTRPLSTLGAQVLCKTTSGITASGSTNNLWDTTATIGACTGVTPAGAVTACRNGFKFCGAVVAGKNDNTGGSGDCRTFAERAINQDGDNNGCPSTSLACP